MYLTVEKKCCSITVNLTVADLMEYKKYRDRETANKKAWPEITVLNPVQWYRVHRPHLISDGCTCNKTTNCAKN